MLCFSTWYVYGYFLKLHLKKLYRKVDVQLLVGVSLCSPQLDYYLVLYLVCNLVANAYHLHSIVDVCSPDILSKQTIVPG